MNDIPFAKKSLGQHWLTDLGTLDAIADAAEVAATDVVLEIGPGWGTLTDVLCRRAERVIAVEFDAVLATDLPRRVMSPNLTVIQQDILRFDLTTVPQNYKLVANIPYYLTSNLVRILSESSNRPTIAVLLVQKEVAQRVAALPGSLSLLSVTAQFYWEVEVGLVVPARLFVPPPKVDSQILILRRRDTPLFNDVDAKSFFRLVKAGFSQRRKTIGNSLSAGLRLSKAEITSLCVQAGVSPTDRPQMLRLDQWRALYDALVFVRKQ